ncbi:hypothetical protein FLW16_19735 [Microbispora sp. KK1-11]|nr:hypothetical protein FLW16_19735 [Microbispora sp. KK1-11]
MPQFEGVRFEGARLPGGRRVRADRARTAQTVGGTRRITSSAVPGSRATSW